MQQVHKQILFRYFIREYFNIATFMIKIFKLSNFLSDFHTVFTCIDLYILNLSEFKYTLNVGLPFKIMTLTKKPLTTLNGFVSVKPSSLCCEFDKNRLRYKHVFVNIAIKKNGKPLTMMVALRAMSFGFQ